MFYKYEKTFIYTNAKTDITYICHARKDCTIDKITVIDTISSNHLYTLIICKGDLLSIIYGDMPEDTQRRKRLITNTIKWLFKYYGRTLFLEYGFNNDITKIIK